MTKIHANRLRKLADHLKRGKLGHKKFDFARINSICAGEDFDERGCGTLGCALGECPIVFPKEWEFRAYIPCLKTGSTAAFESSRKFFGLCSEESGHLFAPWDQNTKDFGGRVLNQKASAEQVASNIYAFLKVKGFKSKQSEAVEKGGVQ